MVELLCDQAVVDSIHSTLTTNVLCIVGNVPKRVGFIIASSETFSPYIGTQHETLSPHLFSKVSLFKIIWINMEVRPLSHCMCYILNKRCFFLIEGWI